MLPSPVDVARAIGDDASLLAHHASVTVAEALIGLAAGIAFGFALAVAMERFRIVDLALSPLVTMSQTIPVVAVAPLLVLWLGYGMLPKVLLVALTTFFPLTVSLASGFRSVDPDAVDLLRSMGASRLQVFRFAQLPAAAPSFFSGLRISVTYAVIAAVVAEWLGGFDGLGVYMTRVRKSYDYDSMFAAIIVIAAVSLALLGITKALERACLPWQRVRQDAAHRKKGKEKAMTDKARGIGALAASAVLVAGLLGGCAGQPAGEEGDGLQPVTLVLDYVPNTNHTGIYVAMENGYYADAGLEVTVVQPPEDGADAMVASGQAQFGISYQDWMANYLGSDEPLPVTAVAAIVQHNTSGIISRAGEGITSPSGLEGKRYGTLDVETEKAIVRSLVEGDGGDWSQVEVVPANSTDEVSGLMADQFDAIWCFEGWAGQNAQVQGFDADYFAIADIDPTFDYYTPVIIANDAFADIDPEAVRAFLAATAQGYAFAAEQPDEAAAILLAAAPEIDPDLALASQRFLANRYQADADRWGVIDPVRWNAFYSWMNDQGLTAQPIALDAGFTNDYL